MNRIVITGRLGKDPEMQYLPSGKALTKITVANDVGFGDHKKTTWFNVECWGQNAEFVNDYGKKGRLVAVEGEMVCEQFNDKYYWKVQFAKVEFLDKVETQDNEPDF